MVDERWAAVDNYFGDLMIGEDPVLDAALAASDAAGLPPIAVSPTLGKLLHLLARATGAQRILEVGTLGGYSTIWLGRALPAGGRLISLEAVDKHAEVARSNVAAAGLSEVVDIRVGPALEALPKLAAEQGDPFDLIFIDADKENNVAYFDWAIRLARPGSMIIVDNVVRDGKVLDANNPDSRVQGSRQFAELVGAQNRASATTLQMVGVKGWDGFTLAVVNDPAEA
ncbi:O-methyltransferase [Pseudonocardia sp. Cha107L01]|uniref:O-methyltransferase n=1 Tax=Pseudonocardia sp. Cha107L01 TaxID=3457576 RepID=UPI00403E6AEE